jgi:hypothetical protein
LRKAHAEELTAVRGQLEAARSDAAEQRQMVSNLREDLAGERTLVSAAEKALRMAEERAVGERNANRELSSQLADAREAASRSEEEASRAAQQYAAAEESARAVIAEKDARIGELRQSLRDIRTKRQAAARKPRTKNGE